MSITPRQHGIDLARLAAAYMVLYGHLIWGGTFATEGDYQAWKHASQSLPILDKDAQLAWLIDFYLQSWQTGLAVVGVGLFFLISGWLIPPMFHRYSRLQFLVNRVFRIFPMLICAVLLAACIQLLLGNGDSLFWGNVLSTMFLANQITDAPYTLGVVWTLVIEFKFYLLLVVLGIPSQRKLLGMATLIVFINTAYFMFGSQGRMISPDVAKLAVTMLHDSYFLLFMLIGSSLRLAFDPDSGSQKIRCLAPLFLIVLFELNRVFTITVLDVTPHQDINFVTQAMIFSLFGICLFWQHRFCQSPSAQHVIAQLSNPTYSVYLLHLSLGTFLLLGLRDSIDNQYLLLAVVILLVTVASSLTYQLIEAPCNALAKQLIFYSSRRFNNS